MATNAPVAGSSTPGAAPTTASRWSRCTFPRSASAPATRPPACGVNEKAETSVKGLYAAGDMAAVPHNYMLGAFTYGWFAGRNAAEYVAGRAFSAVDSAQVERERARIEAPLLREHTRRRRRWSASCAGWSTTTCNRPR